MTSDGLRYFSTAELALTMAMLRTWLCCCLVAALALSETGAEWKKCKDDLNSGGCLALSEHSLDLSPLTGIWQTVFFTEAEGGTQATVPHFFNISLCGAIHESQCSSDSSVCYSEHLDTFYNLGGPDSCQYSYEDRQVQLVFDYSEHAGGIFGAGNVTITLVCGRTLGVPEVIVGDPNSDTIEILWLTSAACKTDTNLATTEERKCYFMQAYEDEGLKARFVDLTNLIRPEGYEITYAERSDGVFKISVCRPLSLGVDHHCNGHLACLTGKDSHFSIDGDVPIPLVAKGSAEGDLHMEGDLLTVVYTETVEECENKKRAVKIHFLCPTGDEAFGPSITFLDDQLCFIEINWYTTYACGTTAYQSTGCQLTNGAGTTFDLSGLGTKVYSVNETTSEGQTYVYELQMCSGTSITTECGWTPPPDIRVAQFDNGVCRSLGVGKGKLRFADGTLSLTYSMGSKCHSNFARTSLINFVCPESVDKESDTEELSFLGEENCFYEFEWVTSLACGSTTTGVSDCQFDLDGSMYNFAPLMGTEDKNWVALDDDENTACFMINPCGELSITDDVLSTMEYCNSRLAPNDCAGYSVCQILNDGKAVPIGTFDLQNPLLLTGIDKNVLTVTGPGDKEHKAVIHYVCKTGDFASPPVFVTKTNKLFYEFHWTTFAACPLGIQTGSDCSVTHQASGFTFNLSSLSSSEYSYTVDKYTYNVAICSRLSGGSDCSKLSDAKNPGACQNGDKSSSLGNFNRTLIYADGTLKLHYNHGSVCRNKEVRNSTILFNCDHRAHKPVINSVTEVDHCQYVIEVETKLACPPAYRATECIHLDNLGHSFDFSHLSKMTGNWQSRGPDGSIYYINVCQPLNRIGGCSPLSAVCRVQNTPSGTVYTNLGLASSASFKVSHKNTTNIRERVMLTYNFTSGAAQGVCEKIETLIEFVCNASIFTESGPKFASGGDKADPCQYNFIWETVGACQVKPAEVKGETCAITDPESDYTYDFSPLRGLQYNVTVDDSSFQVTACGKLNATCHGSNTATTCQHTSDNSEFNCGDYSTQTIRYFEGSKTIWYRGGDVCHHVDANRSVLLNLECDRSVYIGEPRYVQEIDCAYTFEWPTALACPPQELECVAGGGNYNLQALLGNQNWVVNTGNSKDFTLVIGGCKSLNLKDHPQCPQKPGIGACRYPTEGGDQSGAALGFVTGDLVVEGEGELKLSYYNGDKWCGDDKRNSVVNIYFHCSQGAGAGVPTQSKFNKDLCETDIDWLTQYACPLDASSNSSWVITNPVTNQVYDLTKLGHSISRNHTEEDGSTYTYTLGLSGNPVPCPGHGEKNIGACQTKSSTGKAYLLGLLNSTLSFIGGELRVEYLHGDRCHQRPIERKTVISFECDTRDFLEVLPERACEYSFVIHTPLVCEEEENIGVECRLGGFANLGTFLSLHAPPVPLDDGTTAYVSVCEPIGSNNQESQNALQCPKGSAACIILKDGKTHDLGHPDTDSPPALMVGGNGVILNYTHGDCCDEGCVNRYQTDLVLICDRDQPLGLPTLISNTSCNYLFQWKSIHACPLEIPSTSYSNNICTITDPASGQAYNFTNIASQQVEIPGSDTTYYLQLCGSASEPPSGCNGKNFGICKNDGQAKKTLTRANHSIAITSHSPHVFEVVYNSGESCEDDRFWTAVVRMQCKSHGGTPAPVFVSDSNCELEFLWKNSSFCLGEEECAAVDPDTGYVYDLDGLLSQTWAGRHSVSQSSDGGTFTMSVCRNLNPFTSKHCNSPAGICLTSTRGDHMNLGHMTEPPKVDHSGSKPVVVLTYTDGDRCPKVTKKKFSTTVTLVCSTEQSTPMLETTDEDCVYSIVWDTPLACRPEVTESTNCVYNDSQTGRQYNFTSLAHNITFTQDGEKYSICLCKSKHCNPGSIMHNGIHNWGTFQDMMVTSLTSGPRILFTKGDKCSGNVRYQSKVFMECDRNADPKTGNFALQEGISSDCYKLFFWFTPYACLSEEIKCSLTIGDSFYDFTPLHSENKPWRVTGTNGDEYLINICGPVKNTETSCNSDTSVCVKKKDGGSEDLGTAASQQIIATSGGAIQIRFTGPLGCSDTHGSHVTINMICGIGGLKLASSAQQCDYKFNWHTPYACQDDRLVTTTTCEKTITSNNFDFYPSNLHKDNGYEVIDSGSGTYHINFCSGLDVCQGSSVCLDESGGGIKQIGSFKHQKITVFGYKMQFEMTTESGDTHAIVEIQCIHGDKNDPDAPSPETIKLDNVVVTPDHHNYYYFKMWTVKGCKFIVPTEPPTTAPAQPTSPSSDNGGGATRKKVDSSGVAVAGLVVALIIVALLIAVLVGLIIYKRERREHVKEYLMNVISNKSSDTVLYQRAPTHEETALLEEDSDTNHSGGEEGEGTNADDEELINL